MCSAASSRSQRNRSPSRDCGHFAMLASKVRDGVQLEVFGLHPGDCELVAKLDCGGEIEGFVALALKARDMKAQRLQRDFFGLCIVHVGVSPIGKARMASPYRLPGGEPGIRGCKRKIGRGIAHPLGRRASAAAARIFGGLHKRRMATRGRLGRPDFSIAGGVRGTPSAPYRPRRSRRAKFSPCNGRQRSLPINGEDAAAAS